jgi:hypothetical protein
VNCNKVDVNALCEHEAHDLCGTTHELSRNENLCLKISLLFSFQMQCQLMRIVGNKNKENGNRIQLDGNFKEIEMRCNEFNAVAVCTCKPYLDKKKYFYLLTGQRAFR